MHEIVTAAWNFHIFFQYNMQLTDFNFYEILHAACEVFMLIFKFYMESKISSGETRI